MSSHVCGIEGAENFREFHAGGAETLEGVLEKVLILIYIISIPCFSTIHLKSSVSFNLLLIYLYHLHTKVC